VITTPRHGGGRRFSDAQSSLKEFTAGRQCGRSNALRSFTFSGANAFEIRLSRQRFRILIILVQLVYRQMSPPVYARLVCNSPASIAPSINTGPTFKTSHDHAKAPAEKLATGVAVAGGVDMKGQAARQRATLRLMGAGRSNSYRQRELTPMPRDENAPEDFRMTPELSPKLR